MHLVAGHAWHRGFVRKRGADEPPGTRSIHRLHQIANRAIDMHSVATEAIVGKTALGVVFRICKDLRIGCAVRPGMPCRVLMLMASLAAASTQPNRRQLIASASSRPSR